MKRILMVLLMVCLMGAGSAMADGIPMCTNHGQSMPMMPADVIMTDEIFGGATELSFCLHGHKLDVGIFVLSDSKTLRIYNCQEEGGVLGMLAVMPGSSLECHNVNFLCEENVAIFNVGKLTMKGGSIGGEPIPLGALVNMGEADLTDVTIVAGGKVGVSNLPSQLYFPDLPGAQPEPKMTLNNCDIMADAGAVASIGGELTINGGRYAAVEKPENDGDISTGLGAMNTKLTISAGEFWGESGAAFIQNGEGKPVPLTPDVLAPGSVLVDGAFDGQYLRIGSTSNSGMPETGDSSSLLGWTALMALCAAALAARKRRTA